ncbi:MAG: hypothetical protein B7733_20185 [Myxococcales bacterium FL481]|nr:MAG: hypothetical protein B7733_20185 [Myxococcales bacterium FL481]
MRLDPPSSDVPRGGLEEPTVRPVVGRRGGMRAVHRIAWLGAVLVSCEATEDAAPDLEPARRDYALYCALCHGDEGQGYVADGANALAHPDFLAAASDQLLRRAIVRGRQGTPMSGWGLEWGGPLDDAGVAGLVALMRSWQTRPNLSLGTEAGMGQPGLGEAVYAVHCEHCHGPRGAGSTYMSLADPGFLADASDGYLRYAVAKGRAGTPMPAFETTLNASQIDDVVALIRSWQRPLDGSTPALPSMDISDALLNPGGLPPLEFGLSDRFISVEQLKRAYDAAESFIVIDARAPGDYVGGHIQGAVSVPFYAVSDYLDQLPTDVWIVTYCGCPHAASEAAADALFAAGYSQVRVLDEGLDLWIELGYPTEAGP